jgi:TonB family protein
MSYSPAPIPISRGSAKPKVFLNNSLPATEPFHDDPPSAVFDALRQQIESGASIDGILSAIAATAQNLSRASGAAIAMGHDGVVLCVGRSGDTAPELGAQLSVDSGISGECIRSGKSLLCDDSQLDSRVDADVCLRLGLRSIIAVPLRSSDGMVGILEVFSNYPSNFSAGHVETMRTLAELVERAHARIAGAEAVAKEIHDSMILPIPEPTSALPSIDVATPEPRAIEWLRNSQVITAVKKKVPYWLAAPILILILLSVRFWITRQEPIIATVAKSTVAETAAPETIEMTIGSKPARKPRAGRDTEKVHHQSSQSDRQSDQNSDTPEVVVHNFGEQAAADSSPKATEKVPEVTSSQSNSQQDVAPQLPVANANDATLASLVATSATLPRQPLPVSQGVVRGALQYKVQPTYPEQARSMRLAGPVVLLASVSETGTVTHVKIVSGQAVLANAAIAAVKQWRYQPSRLNGAPVGVETQVTVNFKAP